MNHKHFFLMAVAIICVGLLTLNYGELFTQPEQMTRVTGQEDHSISLTEASQFTANYRNSMDEGTAIGGVFGEDAVLAILNQDGVVGLRYYYAMDNAGKRVMVLVGVNEEGDDIVDGLLAERAAPCPPWCSKPNPLNTEVSLLSANY